MTTVRAALALFAALVLAAPAASAAEVEPTPECLAVALGWGPGEVALLADRCGVVREVTDAAGHDKALEPTLPRFALATTAGGRLVTVDFDKTRAVWRRLDALRAATPGTTAKKIHAVALRADGERLALVVSDAAGARSLRIMGPPGAKVRPLSVPLTHPARELFWSPDGRYVAALDNTGDASQVTSIDAVSGEALGVHRADDALYTTLAFRQDGRLVATGLSERVVLLDVRSMKPVGALDVEATYALPVRGGWLYAVDLEPELRFQASTPGPPRVLGTCAGIGADDEVYGLSVSPSGRRALVACRTGGFVADLPK